MNKLLKDTGISSTNNCSLCTSGIETILHLFWECPVTQNFIAKLQTTALDNKIKLTRNMFLFGSMEPISKKYNFVILLAKYYIFLVKNKDPTLNWSGFMELLKQIKNTEQYMSFKTKKFLTHSSNWNEIQLI